jgi:hypothetical protein
MLLNTDTIININRLTEATSFINCGGSKLEARHSFYSLQQALSARRIEDVNPNDPGVVVA